VQSSWGFGQKGKKKMGGLRHTVLVFSVQQTLGGKLRFTKKVVLCSWRKKGGSGTFKRKIYCRKGTWRTKPLRAGWHKLLEGVHESSKKEEKERYSMGKKSVGGKKMPLPPGRGKGRRRGKKLLKERANRN